MVAYSNPSTAAAPKLSDYNYVRFLTRSRTAWEYLRRNPDYRLEWRLSAPGRPQPIQLIDGTVLLRARRRFARAEAWGLCLFRRSQRKRPRFRCFLAG